MFWSFYTFVNFWVYRIQIDILSYHLRSKIKYDFIYILSYHLRSKIKYDFICCLKFFMFIKAKSINWDIQSIAKSSWTRLGWLYTTSLFRSRPHKKRSSVIRAYLYSFSLFIISNITDVLLLINIILINVNSGLFSQLINHT